MNFSGAPGGSEADRIHPVTDRPLRGPGACSRRDAEYLLCRVRRVVRAGPKGPERRPGVAYATLHGSSRYEVDHV